MKFEYDPAVDALYIRLNEGEDRRVRKRCSPALAYLTSMRGGQVAGVEVLDAGKRNATPAPVEGSRTDLKACRPQECHRRLS